MEGVPQPRLELVPWKVTVLIFSSSTSKLTRHFARYRNTATLVSLMLAGGYRCPHRTIDEYVKVFTNFTPTDADNWTVHEPLLLDFDCNATVTKLSFEKMSESSRFL